MAAPTALSKHFTTVPYAVTAIGMQCRELVYGSENIEVGMLSWRIVSMGTAGLLASHISKSEARYFSMKPGLGNIYFPIKGLHSLCQ